MTHGPTIVAVTLVGLSLPVQSPTTIHERNIAVPMRDGVQLRADLLRPSSQGRFPTLVYRTPYGKDDALKAYTTFVHAVERGYAVVVQDVRGATGPPASSARTSARAGTARHDRMGGAAAVVERPRRHVRAVVSRRGAMARRGRKSTASRGHGSGDDLLDAAELLLQRRRLGPVVAAVDLAEHRAASMERREDEDARRAAARGAGSKSCAPSRPTTTTGSTIRPRIRSGTSRS